MVLLPHKLHPFQQQEIETDFTVHVQTDLMREPLDTQLAKCVRAVVAKGSVGFSKEEMAQLPNLGIICAVGVGVENIDVEAAQSRGIVVTNNIAANYNSVADHAFALLLSLARQICSLNTSVHCGEWESARGAYTPVFGRKLGVIGLGNIGRAIASRGFSGFGMEVAYWNRSNKTVDDYQYFNDLEQLAGWADFLVVCAAGGPETRHLVNSRILAALGNTSYLVNIARGSLVDTAALVHAVNSGVIAGAAIDVVENEPVLTSELLSARNLIITPHVGGRSEAALRATGKSIRHHLNKFFTKKDAKGCVN